MSAFRLLTRIPMPAADHDHDAAQSTRWFPLVGGVIGLLLFALATLLSSVPAAIAALLITLSWITITGGLHLDGAADLADGLGAAHGDQIRLLSVMKEPHIGAFGALVLITVIITKLITIDTLLASTDPKTWSLLLIPAWARLGTLYWMRSLDTLGAGLGAHYQQQIGNRAIVVWSIILTIASIMLVSPTFMAAAFIILWAWRWFLHHRVGGMNGDCLGAGIEYCECAMLLIVALLYHA